MLAVWHAWPQHIGGVMGRYESNRAENTARLRGEPFCLPHGLAHVVATVLEPRSDAAPANPSFDEALSIEKRRLLREIDLLVSQNGDIPQAHLGGRIEHLVGQAEMRLRAAAEAAGAEDVVDRLRRLDDERRSGASASIASESGPDLGFDPSEVPRSSSGRRVGLWR